MSRARIVLETTDKRKSAIVEAAALQGATLTDWFEEQVAAAFPQEAREGPHPTYETNDIDALQEPSTAFASLSSRDWSFTEADTRYLTHDLHPYPAKFIPQIPAHLIGCLSMPGDVVLDPFGGSATTAVEAVRLGRRAISFDANPLSALIGRVKTGFMATSVRTDIDQLCAAIDGHIISFTTHQRHWVIHLMSRYREYLPDIPNIEKWFNDYVIGELCLIRHLIEQTTAGLARDAACLALSRVIMRISNQESETRYVSVNKSLRPTIALRAYLESLKAVSRRLENAAVDLQFADARYLVGDSRYDLPNEVGDNSVDLIVTSPPYPNATDYHLYHRFRLFWLGFDPKALGKIEIGSHLRHQRNATGFEEYREDMSQALVGCAQVLVPGRYAVFVVGRRDLQGGELLHVGCDCPRRPRGRSRRSRSDRPSNPPDEALVRQAGEARKVRATRRPAQAESARSRAPQSACVPDVALRRRTPDSGDREPHRPVGRPERGGSAHHHAAWTARTLATAPTYIHARLRPRRRKRSGPTDLAACPRERRCGPCKA